MRAGQQVSEGFRCAGSLAGASCPSFAASWPFCHLLPARPPGVGCGRSPAGLQGGQAWAAALRVAEGLRDLLWTAQPRRSET